MGGCRGRAGGGWTVGAEGWQRGRHASPLLVRATAACCPPAPLLLLGCGTSSLALSPLRGSQPLLRPPLLMPPPCPLHPCTCTCLSDTQVWDQLTGRLKMDLPYQAQEQFMLHDSAVLALAFRWLGWGGRGEGLCCASFSFGRRAASRHGGRRHQLMATRPLRAADNEARPWPTSCSLPTLGPPPLLPPRSRDNELLATGDQDGRVKVRGPQRCCHSRRRTCCSQPSRGRAAPRLQLAAPQSCNS